MSSDFVDDKSILVQVMPWCHQVTSHYLAKFDSTQCCHGFTRPQWVYGNMIWKSLFHNFCSHFQIMQKVFPCHDVIILETAAQLRMERVTMTFSNISCNLRKFQSDVHTNMTSKNLFIFICWFLTLHFYSRLQEDNHGLLGFLSIKKSST